MSGLFDKIRVLGLGTAHAVVDKAIDMNSIPVLEQRVRELEDARKAAQGSLSEANFRYQSEVSHTDTDAKTDSQTVADIKTLMGSNGGNPSDSQKAEAQRLALVLQKLREGKAAQDQRTAAAKAMFDKMTDAVQSIIDQESSIKARVNELRTKVATGHSLDKATKAIEAAGTAANSLGSIDSIEDKINMKSAVSTDAFNNAIASASSGSNTVLEKTKANNLLDEIMGTSQKAA